MRFRQGLIALRQQLGRGQCRLCMRQGSPRAFELRLKWCRIDLIKLLTRLHFAALGE